MSDVFEQLNFSNGPISSKDSPGKSAAMAQVARGRAAGAHRDDGSTRRLARRPRPLLQPGRSRPAGPLAARHRWGLDLGDLRKHLAPFYSHTGRPSIGPDLMIRMLTLATASASGSQRRLCEEEHLNLACRRFCRLDRGDSVGLAHRVRLSRRLAHCVEVGHASGARKHGKSGKVLSHQRIHAFDTDCPQACPPWRWTTCPPTGVTGQPWQCRAVSLSRVRGAASRVPGPGGASSPLAGCGRALDRRSPRNLRAVRPRRRPEGRSQPSRLHAP